MHSSTVPPETTGGLRQVEEEKLWIASKAAAPAQSLTGTEHGLDERGSGKAIGNRNGNHLPARRFHFLAADDLVSPPVRSLYEYIRQQPGDQRLRRELVKNGHVIHAFKRSQDFRTVHFRRDGTFRALDLAHATVAV